MYGKKYFQKNLSNPAKEKIAVNLMNGLKLLLITSGGAARLATVIQPD